MTTVSMELALYTAATDEVTTAVRRQLAATVADRATDVERTSPVELYKLVCATAGVTALPSNVSSTAWHQIVRNLSATGTIARGQQAEFKAVLSEVARGTFVRYVGNCDINSVSVAMYELPAGIGYRFTKERNNHPTGQTVYKTADEWEALDDFMDEQGVNKAAHMIDMLSALYGE